MSLLAVSWLRAASSRPGSPNQVPPPFRLPAQLLTCLSLCHVQPPLHVSTPLSPSLLCPSPCPSPKPLLLVSVFSPFWDQRASLLLHGWPPAPCPSSGSSFSVLGAAWLPAVSFSWASPTGEHRNLRKDLAGLWGSVHNIIFYSKRFYRIAFEELGGTSSSLSASTGLKTGGMSESDHKFESEVRDGQARGISLL